MKPLARARGEGEGGTGERERVTPRLSFVRRRDSAPVHPTLEDEGDVDEGTGEGSAATTRGANDGSGARAGDDEGPPPSAPPAPRAGDARRRTPTPSVDDPMSCAAPLPPWADAGAKRRFTLRSLPNDGTHARCHVLRKRGLFGAFPTYVLYLDGRETTTATLADAVPILVARKRKKAKCTHYVIGDDGAERAVNEAHPSYVCKLKANFIGTRFELFDAGARPRAWGAPGHLGHASDDESDDDDDVPPRRTLANIRYAVNVLGVAGPRSLAVDVMDERGDTVTAALESARPRWNPSHQAYVLDFNGRVTRPSVKNFQLAVVDSAEAAAEANRTSRRVVAQFGRVDDDLFTLDFAHPLGPLTAFAACLSTFESKIGCE